MFYVVVEIKTAHQIETPKDHCQITEIACQIISVDTLECLFTDEQGYTITIGGAGADYKTLQEAIVELDSKIKSIVGDDECVFCSLNSTWHLRVTLQRQAYDERILLPSYLKHPKIFDLWKEYERWCINHPEVMPLRKNSRNSKALKDVNEMLSILELPIEETITSAEIKRVSNILIKLHTKCTSIEDENNILTQPYDSYSDIRAFLQEKSRILYMNNLPPDTTQSELESWFTQFGMRPVGFWTVKNIVEDTSNANNNWNLNNSPYVEEPDSISGFVVFQSHKEAADVLVLNGRSILSNMANTKQPRVVEHIVEIQPSSTTVLDKVQEIASAFPQSKNKPRPGDWNCLSCGFSNFQRRTACFRCAFPAVSNIMNNNTLKYNTDGNKQYIKSQTGLNTANNSNDTARITQNSSSLQYLYNINSQSKVFQTYQLPYDLNTVSYRGGDNIQSGSMHNKQNNGTSNQNNNNNNQQFGNGGSNVPFRAGDWKCTACTYHNFAKNVVCLRCGGPKTPSTQPSINKSHNNGSREDGTYNRVSLMDLKSSISLNDKSALLYMNGSRPVSDTRNAGFGISLDTRSSSGPA